MFSRSKGCEVSDNYIHALKAVWLIREAHSIVLRAVTIPSTLNDGGGGGGKSGIS